MSNRFAARAELRHAVERLMSAARTNEATVEVRRRDLEIVLLAKTGEDVPVKVPTLHPEQR